MADTSHPARSASYDQYLRRQRSQRRAILLWRMALLGIALAIWEIAARAHWVNPLLTSYPSAIWLTLVDLLARGSLLQDTWATLRGTLIGFAISFVGGALVAALLWWSQFLYKVLDPFLVVINAIPKIALVPIFYLWLGADKSIYGMSVAVAIFVVILVIYNGFAAIDPNKLKLARTFGATRAQILLKIVFPGSIASQVAAAKMSIGLSLVGVIVGEFQSAEHGLGFLILNGSQVFKLDVVMAAISVLTVISAAIYFAVTLIESLLERRFGR